MQVGDERLNWEFNNWRSLKKSSTQAGNQGLKSVGISGEPLDPNTKFPTPTSNDKIIEI